MHSDFTPSLTHTSSNAQPAHGQFNAPSSFVLEVGLFALRELFIADRTAQGLTKKSIDFYNHNLKIFIDWCTAQGVTKADQLNPDVIRSFFNHWKETGHSNGGIHGVYRSLRALLRWFEQEYEPSGWRDPLRNIKPPRVDIEPLDPVSIEHVRAMVSTCNGGKFTDYRDKAVMLFMLDTGVRAGELLALNVQDIDREGGVLIRQSKNRRPRTVFLGREARRALRAYLKQRDDVWPALFVSDDNERLRESGLRQILVRRAKRAQVPTPSCHSFRRAFALAMKRGGADLVTLQRLLGHSDMTQLIRYLKQDAEDLRNEHNIISPADAI
jgi:integrase/recombinase XerD